MAADQPRTRTVGCKMTDNELVTEVIQILESASNNHVREPVIALIEQVFRLILLAHPVLLFLDGEPVEMRVVPPMTHCKMSWSLASDVSPLTKNRRRIASRVPPSATFI